LHPRVEDPIPVEGAVIGTKRRSLASNPCPMRRALRLLVVPAALAIPTLARADGTTLRADLVESKSIKLDGVPKEWGGLVSLGSTLKGHNGRPDIEARAGLAYDANNL